MTESDQHPEHEALQRTLADLTHTKATLIAKLSKYRDLFQEGAKLCDACRQDDVMRKAVHHIPDGFPTTAELRDLFDNLRHAVEAVEEQEALVHEAEAKLRERKG
jgi:hypothetical protein